MKVLIASTVVPNVGGGTAVIVDSLERALVERGHEVDVLRLPFVSRPDVMLSQMLALRLHHVEDSGDRLICIRPPSYLLQHPAKVLWFIHHHRTAYDLWGTEYGDMRDDHEGRALRDAIRAADDVAFGESRSIFANSGVVRDRLETFNKRTAEVLYPPLDQPRKFRCDGYGDEIVYVSRLTEHKRQWLAIEAMAHTRTPVSLVVAGAPDSPCRRRAARRPGASTGPAGTRRHSGRMVVGGGQGLPFRVVPCCGVLPVRRGQLWVSQPRGSSIAESRDLDNRFRRRPRVGRGRHERLPVRADARGNRYPFRRAVRGPEPRQAMGDAGFGRIVELGISWEHVIGRLLS